MGQDFKVTIGLSMSNYKSIERTIWADSEAQAIGLAMAEVAEDIANGDVDFTAQVGMTGSARPLDEDELEEAEEVDAHPQPSFWDDEEEDDELFEDEDDDEWPFPAQQGLSGTRVSYEGLPDQNTSGWREVAKPSTYVSPFEEEKPEAPAPDKNGYVSPFDEAPAPAATSPSTGYQSPFDAPAAAPAKQHSTGCGSSKPWSYN